jgi:5-oxoprolinase (ATP-hydrolysing)
MTNSRLTDPEIPKARFLVLLRELAIHRGSGGSGRYRGGDGVIRTLKFQRPHERGAPRQPLPDRPFGVAGVSPEP